MDSAACGTRGFWPLTGKGVSGVHHHGPGLPSAAELEGSPYPALVVQGCHRRGVLDRRFGRHLYHVRRVELNVGELGSVGHHYLSWFCVNVSVVSGTRSQARETWLGSVSATRITLTKSGTPSAPMPIT